MNELKHEILLSHHHLESLISSLEFIRDDLIYTCFVRHNQDDFLLFFMSRFQIVYVSYSTVGFEVLWTASGTHRVN